MLVNTIYVMEESIMFCTKCGMEISEKLKFCPKCGEVLENQSAVQTVSGFKFAGYIKPAAIILVIIVLIGGVYAFFAGNKPEDTAKNWINLILAEKYDETLKLYSVDLQAGLQTSSVNDHIPETEIFKRINWIITQAAQDNASSFTYKTQKISDSSAKVIISDKSKDVVYTLELSKFDKEWVIVKVNDQFSPTVLAKFQEYVNKNKPKQQQSMPTFW